MKKWACTFLLIGGLTAFALLPRPTVPAPGVTPENIRRLHSAMKKVDLEALFGAPADPIHNTFGESTWWAWHHADGRVAATFDEAGWVVGVENFSMSVFRREWVFHVRDEPRWVTTFRRWWRSLSS